MTRVGVLLAALVLAAPASAADRVVTFGDAFELQADDPTPFDRLADGRLVCLTAACAGRTVSVGGVSIRVTGRVTAKQVAAARPPYVAPTERPPKQGFDLLAAALFVAAATLAVVAGILAVAGLRRRRRGRAPIDALRRALRLVRESAGRPPGDRRRALDHLAATLGDEPPADRATQLAWARPAPGPEATVALADEVAR